MHVNVLWLPFLPSHEMFIVSTAPGRFHEMQKNKKTNNKAPNEKNDARGTKLRTVPLMQEV